MGLGKFFHDQEMGFLDHLEELRWRIIKSLIVILFFAVFGFWKWELIIEFLKSPIQHVDPQPEIIFLKPAGIFIVRMKIAFFGGLLCALPFVFYQLWAFIVPGLYKSEIKLAILFIFSTLVCFSIGFFFAYIIILPLGLQFLLGMTAQGIIPQLDINSYITFVIQLIFVFGLVFELPVITSALAKMGLVNAALLKKIRPYAIIVIFVISAFITPPDMISQVLLGIPLLILYEISIFLAGIFSK